MVVDGLHISGEIGHGGVVRAEFRAANQSRDLRECVDGGCAAGISDVAGVTGHNSAVYLSCGLKKVGLFVGSHEDVRKELPRKTEQVLACELTPVQARCYEAYLRGEQVQLALAGRVTPFKAIVRLRQICNHPAFFHREEAGSGGEVVLRHTDGMFFVEESVRGVGDGEEEEDNQGRR